MYEKLHLISIQPTFKQETHLGIVIVDAASSIL